MGPPGARLLVLRACEEIWEAGGSTGGEKGGQRRQEGISFQQSQVVLRAREEIWEAGGCTGEEGEGVGKERGGGGKLRASRKSSIQQSGVMVRHGGHIAYEDNYHKDSTNNNDNSCEEIWEDNSCRGPSRAVALAGACRLASRAAQ